MDHSINSLDGWKDILMEEPLVMNKLCRLCGSSGVEFISIYADSGLESQLALKIEKYLPIQVFEDDDLPQQICHCCASAIITWDELYALSVKVDKKFQEYIRNEKIKTYLEDDTNNECKGLPIKVTESWNDTPVGTVIHLAEKRKRRDHREFIQEDKRIGRGQVNVTNISSEEEKEEDIYISCNKESSAVVRSFELPTQSSVNFVEDFKLPIKNLNTKTKETSKQPSLLGNAEKIYLKTKDGSPDVYDSYYTVNDKQNCQYVIYKLENNSVQLTNSCIESESVRCTSEPIPVLNSPVVYTSGETILATTLPLEMDHDYVIPNVDIPETLEFSMQSLSDNKFNDVDLNGSKNGIFNVKHSKPYVIKIAKRLRHIPYVSVKWKQRSHTKTVICRYCGCTFGNEVVLQTHLRFHYDSPPFYCKYCRKKFRLSLSLKLHLQVCSERDIESSSVIDPLKKRNNYPYMCLFSDKSYKLKPNLKEHLRHNFGKGRLKFKCDICARKFLKKAEVLEHIKCHNSLPLLSCDKCDKSFMNRKSLQDHQVSHSDLRPFSCLECSLTYKRKSHLARHIQSHGNENRRVRIPVLKRNPDEEFKCEVCGKISRTKRLLVLHMISHTGERNYECLTCFKRFAQSGALSRHIHTVHGGAKDYVCDICSQRFTAKATKENHMRIHTGEKPFQCPECGKTFRTQQQYKIHEKIHSDDRPYACPYCPKSFRRRPHLVVHIRTHTGEKPYPCPICSRCFAQKNDMTKHLNVHKKLQ